MSRKITIINVAESAFEDWPGGVARLVMDLARKQVEWGYRVYVIGTDWNSATPRREEHHGYALVRSQRIRYGSPDPRNLVGTVLAARKTTRELVAELGGVDVIHSHSPLQGLGASLGAPGAFQVHSIHSPWLLEVDWIQSWEMNRSGARRARAAGARALARLAEWSALGRPGLLTAFSEFTRQELQRCYPRLMARKRFEVFPGWVDLDRFRLEGARADWSRVLGRPPRGPVLFTLRALVPRNGLPMLLDAAALLKQQGREFELVIGGDGALRSLLEARAAELGLLDRVSLIGRVPDETLPDYYRGCDAFVLPTQALECFGIIILEALACGKPVIATPVAAIPEKLSRTYPEGLIEDAMAPALARAIARHLEAPGGRIAGARSAGEIRELIEREYSIEVGTGRFREVYERAGG